MLVGTISNTTTWSTAVLEGPVGPADGTDNNDVDPRFWWLDQDTGHIWTQEPSEGEDDVPPNWEDGGVPLPPGSVPPGDGLPPPQVTGLVVAPLSLQHPDGTVMPALDVSWDDLTTGTPDISAYEVQSVRTGEPWANPLTRMVGKDEFTLVLDNLIGGTSHDVRARCHDIDGYVGPWSTTVTETAPGDTIPPDVMDPPSLNPGYKLLAVSWSHAGDSQSDQPAIDITFYQVRWRKQTDLVWTLPVQAKSTILVVQDLDYDLSYGVEVRAVDRSGNVNDGAGAAVPYDAESSAELGWSTEAIAQPLDIGTADAGFDTIVANIVQATEISADQITAGDLSMGLPGQAGVIRIYDGAGQPIGAWSTFGLISADPYNPTRAIWRAPDGSMKFTDGYDWDPVTQPNIEDGIDTTVWTTAIDHSGINAQAITFGAAGGGNNRVLNAGFELQDFVGSDQAVSEVWTDTAEWVTALSQVNLRTDGPDLRMTKEP